MSTVRATLIRAQKEWGAKLTDLKLEIRESDREIAQFRHLLDEAVRLETQARYVADGRRTEHRDFAEHYEELTEAMQTKTLRCLLERLAGQYDLAQREFVRVQEAVARKTGKLDAALAKKAALVERRRILTEEYSTLARQVNSLD